MNGSDKLEQSTNIMVELIHNLNSADLNDLCDAAEAAIIDGGGFGWLGTVLVAVTMLVLRLLLLRLFVRVFASVSV